jgi:hypothetical protein
MYPIIGAGWILLVISLPGRQGTPRMRVWRALKSAGAAVLRDGVYLLPRSEGARAAFAEQAKVVGRAGGSAHLLDLGGVGGREEETFRTLFDRTPRYVQLIERLQRRRARLTPRSRHAVREIHRLRREYEAVRAVDHFPGPAAAQAEELLRELETAIRTLASPGEPRAAGGTITPRRLEDYRERVWATRARPWVDRLASAWLIRRFIDPKARFLWLANPKQCPPKALGFDFDGATFTHNGSRVTFETLLASFGLEGEPALRRLGAIVHYLDVGGAPMPEARGLEMVLTGARRRCRSDNDLLANSRIIFDDLYTALCEK